jgi:hypothetical protein
MAVAPDHTQHLTYRLTHAETQRWARGGEEATAVMQQLSARYQQQGLTQPMLVLGPSSQLAMLLRPEAEPQLFAPQQSQVEAQPRRLWGLTAGPDGFATDRGVATAPAPTSEATQPSPSQEMPEGRLVETPVVTAQYIMSPEQSQAWAIGDAPTRAVQEAIAAQVAARSIVGGVPVLLDDGRHMYTAGDTSLSQELRGLLKVLGVGLQTMLASEDRGPHLEQAPVQEDPHAGHLAYAEDYGLGDLHTRLDAMQGESKQERSQTQGMGY